jgi:hypothetical protein
VTYYAVSLHPAAMAEVEAAEAWYAAERVELGDAFVADLEATVTRVAGNPFAFAERSPGARQAVRRSFVDFLTCWCSACATVASRWSPWRTGIGHPGTGGKDEPSNNNSPTLAARLRSDSRPDCSCVCERRTTARR